jgi:hypothetical protein
MGQLQKAIKDIEANPKNIQNIQKSFIDSISDDLSKFENLIDAVLFNTNGFLTYSFRLFS